VATSPYNATSETLQPTNDSRRLEQRVNAVDRLPQNQSRPESRVLGTGSYVPDRVVTNSDLAQKIETTNAWIQSRTGIRERRIASSGENTSDMAVHAARSALAAANLSSNDIDLIIVATVTPDQPLPATAIQLKKKLEIGNGCPAFDVAAACCGFVCGLQLADSLIKSGIYRRILLVGVELLSRMIDWQDRESCILFGDGAGAVVLGPSPPESGPDADSGLEPSRIIATRLYSDSDMAEAIEVVAGGTREPVSALSLKEGRQFVRMDGKRVFKFAVERLVQSCRDILDENGLSASQVDWVVPHQANMRILQLVSAQCGIEINRFLINIERYGNTSSASCPLAFDEGVNDGRIKRGDLVLFCALGSGIVWGCSLVRY